MSDLAQATIVLAPRLADNVPLLGVALAGAMYWRGGARRRSRRLRASNERGRDRAQRLRTIAFGGALATLVLALQEPLDGLSDRFFWAHMTQHVLLLVVVAPLLVIAAPWMRTWRVLPLRARRTLAKTIARAAWAAPLRITGRVCAIPLVAWGLMNLDVIAWHVPSAYDLTLRSTSVHYAEHLSFLLFAVLAWAQVIDSSPYRSRLEIPQRIAFALTSMMVGWALALALAFARSAWYAPYAQDHRGGISALADQQLAAGIMWVPASLPWSLAVFVLIYLGLSARKRTVTPQVAGMASIASMPEAPSPAERAAIAPTVKKLRRIHA